MSLHKFAGLLILCLIPSSLLFSQERSSAKQSLSFAVYRPILAAADKGATVERTPNLRKVTVEWKRVSQGIVTPRADLVDPGTVRTIMRSKERAVLTVTD